MNRNVFIKFTNDSFSVKMNLFNCISDMCLFISLFNSRILYFFWSCSHLCLQKQTNINWCAGASSILSVGFYVYFVKNLPLTKCFFSSNVTQSTLIAETVQMKCLAQGHDGGAFISFSCLFWGFFCAKGEICQVCSCTRLPLISICHWLV